MDQAPKDRPVALDADLLVAALGCTRERADLFAQPLNDACLCYEIDTPERLAASVNMPPGQPRLDAPNLSLRDADSGRNTPLSHAVGKHGPDLANYFGVQLCSSHIGAPGESFRFGNRAVVLAPRSCWQHGVDDDCRVSHVVSVRHVLKILKPVVCLLPILVVDGHPIGPRTEKRLAYEPVHEERAPLAVSGKAHVQIAVVIWRRLQMALGVVIAVAAPYASSLGRLIHAFVPQHRAPLCLCFHRAFIVPESSIPETVV